MRKQILTIFVALCFSAIVVAQQPQGGGEHEQLPSHVQRLNHVPVNQEILKVKLPHPKEAQLPNGLTLMVLEQHNLPTISVTLWIKSGALSDPKDMLALLKTTLEVTMTFHGNVITLTPRRHLRVAPVSREQFKPSAEAGK